MNNQWIIDRTEGINERLETIEYELDELEQFPKLFGDAEKVEDMTEELKAERKELQQELEELTSESNYDRATAWNNGF